MATGYTFISYSRKQLYFAEALTLHLQKHGVECWFDLQQLEAGTDWARDLQEGYDKCDRLILVASRAALASPYVAVEWETALKNGREVILAVFEDVEIPEKLKGAPVFDFRGNFDAKLRQLLAYLDGGQPLRDPVPGPNRLGIPKRMPTDIWLMLVNMLLPALWIAVILPISWGWLASLGSMAVSVYLFALLVAIGYVLVFVLPFLRHKQNYDRLRLINLIVLGAQVIQAIGNIVFLPSSSILPAINSIAAASLLFTLYVYLVLLNRSGALLRWFPAGKIPQKMRRRIHGRLVEKGAHESLRDETAIRPVPVTYFIHHDPADRPEADKIEKTLAEFGHQKAAAAAGAAKQILLVTNRTSRKLVEEVSGQYGGEAIYILGATVDFGNDLSQAGQFQWVDFRENDRKEIELLGRSLHDVRAWQRESALEAAPTEFQAFDAPDMVHLLRLLGLLQVGTALGYGLALLILGGWGKMYATIIYLLFGAIMYWLVERMLFRRASLLIYTAMIFFVSILPGLLSGSVINYSMLIFLAFAYPSARSWFPARAKPAPDAIGMDADKKIRRGARLLAGVFVAIGFIIMAVLLRMAG